MDIVVMIYFLVNPLDSDDSDDFKDSNTLFAIMIFEALFTFMLYYLSLFVFSFDIGKIEFLSHNRKVFGIVICTVIFWQYILQALIFFNFEIAFVLVGTELRLTGFVVMQIMALFFSILPLIQIFREERAEV